jgi:hypothetical protein
MKNASQFFAYATERYKIFLDKEAGKPKPWTQDKILQTYRFCNIFREDDVVTRYMRRTIMMENYDVGLVGATVISRLINRPSTLSKLIGTGSVMDDLLYRWVCIQDHELWSAMVRERLEGVQPIINGAYIVSTTGGMNKLDGLLHCFKPVLAEAIELQEKMEKPGCTLQHACELLQQFPHIGAFLSYEIVTDLRHTILQNAPDIMTWANPGPGAARGLGRVMGIGVNHFNRGSKKDVAEMMFHMQTLLKLSKDDNLWNQNYPSWEMREVEHTLCEFDKYERARLGEGSPKQQYPGKA